MLRKIVDAHCHVVGHPGMMSEELRNIFAKIFPWDCGVPTPEVLLEQMDKAGVQLAEKI